MSDTCWKSRSCRFPKNKQCLDVNHDLFESANFKSLIESVVCTGSVTLCCPSGLSTSTCSHDSFMSVCRICECGTLISDPDYQHICVHLSGARSGRHDICKSVRMVPRNAVRRHACEQAAQEPPPPNAGTSTSTRDPGVRQQGRPPRSASNKNGGAGHSLSFTHQGQQGGLRVHTRRQARVSRSVKRPRYITMRRPAHRVVHMQRWRTRLLGVGETKQSNRSGC